MAWLSAFWEGTAAGGSIAGAGGVDVVVGTELVSGEVAVVLITGRPQVPQNLSVAPSGAPQLVHVI